MMSPITSAATPQIMPVKSERPHRRPATSDGTKMISRCVVVMGLARSALPARHLAKRLSLHLIRGRCGQRDPKWAPSIW
jgi:hypothetical protein